MPATCDGTCDSRENLKLLLDYLQAWSFGRIIDRRPGESITRDRMHDLMAHRAHTDEEFRQELLNHPRLVYMIALEEAMGIDKLDYVCQVKEVRVLEETREILYVVLPTCHYGCQADGVSEPPAASAGQCHVCGMSLPAQGCRTAELAAGPSRAETWTPSRRVIESRLVDQAARDAGFRNALLFRPIATYLEFAREACSGELPSYLEGVSDIRVLPETDRSIFFILPAEDPLTAAAGTSLREEAPVMEESGIPVSM